MNRFLKYSLAFLCPFFILLISYVLLDPFKVLWHYDNYYVEGDGASVNRSFVSTMNYLNKRDTYHYDSFIFGNSRSLYYRINEWKRYIPQNASCYHFSESGGSVNGIFYKCRLIDEEKDTIKNALIVLDHDILERLEQDGHLFMMPPALTGYRNTILFHTESFIQWTNLRFLVMWIDYKITGKYKSYMEDYIAKGTNYSHYNPITNEEPRSMQDSLIEIGKYYDQIRMKDFRKRQTPSVSSRVLEKERINVLKKIKQIFDKHHTNYKIIISPLFDQVKLNPLDYNSLCAVFGEQNVYDFSGVNKWTCDYHNYYETSHYLPSVASEIMQIIYE